MTLPLEPICNGIQQEVSTWLLCHLYGDVFSVEDDLCGEISLVDRVTLEMLLNQRTGGSHE